MIVDLITERANFFWVLLTIFSLMGCPAVSGAEGVSASVVTESSVAKKESEVGHGDAVNRVVFSPDGRMLAVASNSKNIQLWNLSTGELRILSGHTDHVLSVAFSPDGKSLVSGGSDKMVLLWDVATGQMQRSLEGHKDAVMSVAFSPDGRAVFSASVHYFRSWDFATGNELNSFTWPLNLDEMTHHSFAAFSADGKTVVLAVGVSSGSHDIYNLRIIDLLTGKELRTQKGHTNSIKEVIFSPEGKSLVSASLDGAIKFWGADNGRELRTINVPGQYVGGNALSVALSSDGKYMASGNLDDTLKLWNLSLEQKPRSLQGHRGFVNCVVFSPDGKTLVSGSSDGTVKLWRISDGILLATLTSFSDAHWTVFAPNGRFDASDTTKNPHVHWAPNLSPIALASLEDRIYEPGLLKTVMGFKSDSVPIVPKLEMGLTNKLPEKLAPRLVVQSGHGDKVNSVVFSSDGKIMASGSDDLTIKLWDVATGRELRTLTGHPAKVENVAFSPDMSSLVSLGEDGTSKLWDVATGRELRTITWKSGYGKGVAFSPDGKSVALAGGVGILKLWEVSTGKELRTFTGHSGGVLSIAFSPDGKIVMSGSNDKSIKLWDLATGKEIRTLNGHNGWVNSVSFSPDGHTLASGSSDKTIKLWDVGSGRELSTLSAPKNDHEYRFDDNTTSAIGGHTGSVDSVAFSHDGLILATGSSDRTVRLWNVATGHILRTLFGFMAGVNSISFSPIGHTLATASDDKTIKLWDVASGNELQTMGRNSGEFELFRTIQSVAFSPDGRTLASGSQDKTIKLWDVATGRELRTLSGHENFVYSVAFSPDGHMLASGSWDQTIKLWDVATGRELQSLNGNGGNITSVVFSPDGHTLASGYDDKTLKLWDVSTGRQLASLKGHKDYVGSVAFSPDGHTLASGGGDKTIKLWDVASGNELRTLTGYAGWFSSVVFSPDGLMLASGSGDKTIKLWDVSSGNELRILRGHTDIVNSVTFSQDGLTLASGSSDKTTKLWDVGTGRQLRTLGGASGSIVSVVFSPGGRMLATGDDNGAIKLWDVAAVNDLRANELFSIQGFGIKVNSAAFFRGGNTLISMNEDRSFNLWNVETGQQQSFHTAVVDVNYPTALSPDGHTIASGIKLSDLLLGEKPRSMKWEAGDPHFYIFPSSSEIFSPDGHILAVSCSTESYDDPVWAIKLWDVSTGKQLNTLTWKIKRTDKVIFLPDGRTVAVYGFDFDKKIYAIKMWDVVSGRELRIISSENFIDSFAISPDGRVMAIAAVDYYKKTGEIHLLDVATGSELRSLAGHGDTASVQSLSFSPDGRTLASGNKDGNIKLWNVESGLEMHILSGHGLDVRSVSFSPDGRILISGGQDKSIRLWRVSDGVLLATLYSFTDGSWVATDPEGRFDTADLEEIKGLHWVMPDDPLTPVPLEAFMKDYYEPRLLPRILNGEKFKPVGDLMKLNRVQSEVKITKVTTDSKDPELALVEVEVSGAQKEYEQDGKKVFKTTNAKDLHLFRDGQLVGYIDGLVVKQGDKPYRQTFNVHLPSAMSGKEITFSAYAFNDNRVKSTTARQSYQVPSNVVVKKGNAYIITMGVNQFDNPAWNLRFAANDARLMRKSLSEKLEKTGAYQNIVPLSLISDGDEHHADKLLLRAILDRLAGKPVSPLLKELPGAEQLQPATPDDLVMITFSGHGYADGSGNFFLLTQDTGKGTDKHVDEDLLKRSISSEELSQWLKDVDAGDMTMIVDACQSAASVQGKDFKPGPMGSRGLGQLSFDKGMRILAASQADEYALENDQIKQGLLSFALVTNGIEGFEADNAPKDGKIMLDEWLRYGVSRVPSLAEEVKTGKVLVASRGGGERAAVLVSTSGTGKPRPAQQPALFDFAKKRRQVEVAGP